MASPTNRNGGRPKKPIDWKEAEKLCVLQCSEIEIADWFHISVDTLSRRLKEEKNTSFAEFFALHRVQGKIALRRNMFKMSESSPKMAIFLAKNFLGMADKQEIEHSGNQNKPITIRGVDGETKKLLGEVLNGEGTEGGDTNNPSI